jgi:hypothetical protein
MKRPLAYPLPRFAVSQWNTVVQYDTKNLVLVTNFRYHARVQVKRYFEYL